MANPQAENGFTRIANEILEALARIRISGESRQVLDVILRKTYGFGKKEDCISLSQFYLATGIAKSSLVRAIKNLEKMNLIYKKVNDSTCVYQFIKDYSLWKPFTKKQIVYQKVKNRLPKSNPQKIITKEIYCQTSNEVRLSELLLNLIRQRNVNFRQPDIQKWAGHIDKVLRLDRRPPEEIEKVITWCQADSFWQSNILSTQKLREKYDQLFLKMNGNGKQPERQRYF